MQKAISILAAFFLMLSFSAAAELQFGSDSEGFVTASGTLTFKDDNFTMQELYARYTDILEMMEAFSDYDSFIARDEENGRITFKYDYNIYIDNDTTKAGSVSFYVDFQFSDQTLTYSVYNFEHCQCGGSIPSLGKLLSKYDGEQFSALTRRRYIDLVDSAKLNVAGFVRSVRNLAVR